MTPLQIRVVLDLVGGEVDHDPDVAAQNAVAEVVPNLMEGEVVHIPYVDARLSGDFCLPKIIDAHHWVTEDVNKEATFHVRVDPLHCPGQCRRRPELILNV